MHPVVLRSQRLVLDQPTLDDVDLIAEYCSDPLFEAVLTTPWPYRRKHAVGFVTEFVPGGWANDGEYTWALRHDGVLLGVIGWRRERGDVGFWLGAPHRGQGFMPEALTAVLDFVFSLGVAEVEWSCFVDNEASASVARKAGFRFDGEQPSHLPYRDGRAARGWYGTLRATDSREEKPGWPA